MQQFIIHFSSLLETELHFLTSQRNYSACTHEQILETCISRPSTGLRTNIATNIVCSEYILRNKILSLKV